MNIEFYDSPCHSDIEYLRKKIDQETPEFCDYSPFGIFIRDKNEKIIAGCNGYIIFGIIYTDQLWVDKHYRKSGIARTLLNKVHEHGRKNQCNLATVCTMSFQGALDFYKKLGYEIDFARNGYRDESTGFFLSKKLKFS